MNDSLPYKEDLSESDLRNSNTPYIKRKILLLGGQEVGKTAFIRRFKNNIYNEEYEPTIQITTKKVILLNNDYIGLELVDMEGQSEYTIFSPNKYAFGYDAYILVYDVQNKKSFELIKFIYEQINNLSGKTSKILIGAKSDKNLDFGVMNDREVSYKEGQEFADNIHCPFIEISSQDNKNIEEAFRLLLIEINKTEAGFNLKQLKFKKTYEFFIHHPKLMTNCYYINLIFLFLISLLSIFHGIYKEVDKDNNDNDNDNDKYIFGLGFPFIILGFWGIIFNGCGFYGMIIKNAYLIGLNRFGLIIDIIYLIISFVEICIIYGVNYNIEDIIFILVFIFNLLLLLSIIFLSKIFKTIYQKDLPAYMA